MPSNGLSLSQCDLSNNQIAAPPASSLKTWRSPAMTGGPAIEVDGRTKVGVSGSGEVEVNEVESQMETAKSRVMIFR